MFTNFGKRARWISTAKCTLFLGGLFVDQMSSVPHIAAAAAVAGTRCRFSGDRGEFCRLGARGTRLELITFGFYRFWLATDIRRHLWSHTAVDGDAPEYTGRGRELLVGFLFALAILVPIYLVYSLIGVEAERLKAFASFPLFCSSICSANSRSIARGVTGSPAQCGAACVSGWTVRAGPMRCVRQVGPADGLRGAVLPWREAALERYKMRHCYYGDLQGALQGAERSCSSVVGDCG